MKELNTPEKQMSVSLNLLIEADENVIKETVEAIKACLRMMLPGGKYNITLMLCDDEYIKKLNSKFRNKNTATDVLSFPLLESSSPGKVVYDDVDIDPDTKEVMLGDIIISYQRALAQAEEFGHTKERELTYLAIHSLLHLIGYDHKDDESKKQMRGKEEELLTILGINR